MLQKSEGTEKRKGGEETKPPPDIHAELRFLRTHSLPTVVQREIERMILSGELPAGQRINENMLAAKLSVSRGPIREACRKLEQAGLVEVVVNRGVFVRKLSLTQALELYDIRIALAALAGRKLAGRVTDGQIAVLTELVERMEVAARAGDLEAYYPLNLGFHSRLMEFAASPRLAAMYLGTDKELHLFRRQSLITGDGLRASNAEHRRILETVKAGNAEAAARAMAEHAEHGRDRMLRAVEAAESAAPVTTAETED